MIILSLYVNAYRRHLNNERFLLNYLNLIDLYNAEKIKEHFIKINF